MLPVLEEPVNPASVRQAGISRREDPTIVEPGGERRAGSSLEEHVVEWMVPSPHVEIHGRKDWKLIGKRVMTMNS